MDMFAAHPKNCKTAMNPLRKAAARVIKSVILLLMCVSGSKTACIQNVKKLMPIRIGRILTAGVLNGISETVAEGD